MLISVFTTRIGDDRPGQNKTASAQHYARGGWGLLCVDFR